MGTPEITVLKKVEQPMKAPFLKRVAESLPKISGPRPQSKELKRGNFQLLHAN